MKEFQRRLGFLPNGMVEPKTSQAIQSALGSSLPGATSWLKMFKTIQDALFAEKAADLDRLAFLDRGMDEVKLGDFPLSPRAEIRRVAVAKSHPRHPSFLADQGHGVTLVSTADPMGLFQPDIQQSVFAFTGPAGLRFHGG